MEERVVVQVNLEHLRLGLSPRRLDDRHVALLQQCLSALPAILVHRDSMLVVDGLHRLHAARRAGLLTIAVVWFQGSLADASDEAIRANVGHGKPLTIDERRRAARRILLSDPSRSDRCIAEICGLSPKTVADVRRAAGEEIPYPSLVVGRDGRLQSRLHRASVPKTSGADPGKGATPASTPRRLDRVVESPIVPPETSRPLRPWWELDSALASQCPALVAWLTATQLQVGEWKAMVLGLPTSRNYEIVDEVRRRAALLLRLAAELERGR